MFTQKLSITFNALMDWIPGTHRPLFRYNLSKYTFQKHENTIERIKFDESSKSVKSMQILGI